MLRFFTSGESHGQALLAFLEGMPAGLKVDVSAINAELALRQTGYGRSSRQKLEKDEVKVLSGIRHGITTGAPVALLINNRDHVNWTHVMSAEEVDLSDEAVIEQFEKKAIKRFRPGHADLSGTLKFRHQDVRNVLERSSARETAARVAAGSLCGQLLRSVGIKSTSHVLQIGSVKITADTGGTTLDELDDLARQSDLLCIDKSASADMVELINKTWQKGDTLGGIVEVLFDGLPIGLGSYTQWDLKLDGRLAQALMSIQAIKAVEIGDGTRSACSFGSQVHDAIYPADEKGKLPFLRQTNHAGGLEGGMTNGERVILRAFMKPIPTLREGLASLSFPDFLPDKAHYERSDVCAVPACAVVCKAMANIIFAAALLDKFAGDNIVEVQRAVVEYKEYCQNLAKKND